MKIIAIIESPIEINFNLLLDLQLVDDDFAIWWTIRENAIKAMIDYYNKINKFGPSCIED